MKSSDSGNELRTRFASATRILVLIGLMSLALFAYGCGGDDTEGDAGATATEQSTGETADTGAAEDADAEEADSADTAAGKEKFASSCGACHKLADAETTGSAGPNLDDLKPDAKRVLDAIKNGGTGSGAMPKDLLTGADAQSVSDYIAASAGK